MSLLVHRESDLVTKDDLALIPTPEATESYVPVLHHHLVDTLSTIGQDILKGFELKSEQYALARDGRQMFGVLTFNNGNANMGLSIGFRNSYDKSMAIGIAIGANVFVCDNLALTGDITILRKHTANVWKDIENTAIATLYRSQKNFEKVVLDAELLKQRAVSDDDAFRTLGLLFGHGVISPRQLPAVKLQWLKPAYDEFKPRSMWSFYNACTESLKTCPPVVVMEKHIQLHTLIMAN